MRILEARFHPDAEHDRNGVIVGRVFCGERKATVAPDPGFVASGTAATTLSKLQYLVDICAPQPYERLQRLRSRFWSFVEVTHAPTEHHHDP